MPIHRSHEADFSGGLVTNRLKMPQPESSLRAFQDFGIEMAAFFRNARARGNFPNRTIV